MTKPTSSNRWRTLALAAVVIAASAIVVAIVAVAISVQRSNDNKTTAREAKAAAVKAQGAVRLLVEQRTESRLQVCLKDKKFAEAHNSLVYALAHSDPHATAATQARIDAEAAPHFVDVPDCTAAGIAAFYAGQGGSNPAVLPTPDMPTTTTTGPERRTTTPTRPTTSTSRAPATSTTFRSSSTTTATPCTGVSIPGGLPCL